eukprot:5730179-Pyramimonas_sp.AAC.1
MSCYSSLGAEPCHVRAPRELPGTSNLACKTCQGALTWHGRAPGSSTKLRWHSQGARTWHVRAPTEL